MPLTEGSIPNPGFATPITSDSFLDDKQIHGVDFKQDQRQIIEHKDGPFSLSYQRICYRDIVLLILLS